MNDDPEEMKPYELPPLSSKEYVGYCFEKEGHDSWELLTYAIRKLLEEGNPVHRIHRRVFLLAYGGKWPDEMETP